MQNIAGLMFYGIYCIYSTIGLFVIVCVTDVYGAIYWRSAHWMGTQLWMTSLNMWIAHDFKIPLYHMVIGHPHVIHNWLWYVGTMPRYYRLLYPCSDTNILQGVQTMENKYHYSIRVTGKRISHYTNIGSTCSLGHHAICYGYSTCIKLSLHMRSLESTCFTKALTTRRSRQLYTINFATLIWNTYLDIKAK